MTTGLLVVPLALQALAMLVDEGHYHRRRGLPRWERIGHPLDTLTIALCLVWLLTVGVGAGYVALAIFSCLFVTKDEVIHAKVCTPGEQWLHAILFVLHPIVLAAFAFLPPSILTAQLGLTIAVLGYQVIYWNVLRPRAESTINNRWYADLGARWYEAQDTPIALLRAEARHRNPWIASEIIATFGPRPVRVLDLGCGAGFLANDLAARGHQVVGVDTTQENLDVARARGTATYVRADACRLPFADGSFAVVCMMDLLEHVETPAQLIAEASRVLVPGGLVFFHTFNRTWQSNLIVIKGVELLVRNTPDDLHVLHLFLTPDEVREMCAAHGLEITTLVGSRPRFRWPLWRMVLTGRVGDDFAFTFTPSTKLGYTGCARRVVAARAPDAQVPVIRPRKKVDQPLQLPLLP